MGDRLEFGGVLLAVGLDDVVDKVVECEHDGALVVGTVKGVEQSARVGDDFVEGDLLLGGSLDEVFNFADVSHGGELVEIILDETALAVGILSVDTTEEQSGFGHQRDDEFDCFKVVHN